MIDFSHANCRKQYERQMDVARDVAGQVAGGDRRVIGAMIESHINPGRQERIAGKTLAYGVSITDACIGWDATVEVLDLLSEAVVKRRVAATNFT
jgi:3-deoxy-7-phosphoheptulonate synthase